MNFGVRTKAKQSAHGNALNRLKAKQPAHAHAIEFGTRLLKSFQGVLSILVNAVPQVATQVPIARGFSETAHVLVLMEAQWSGHSSRGTTPTTYNTSRSSSEAGNRRKAFWQPPRKDLSSCQDICVVPDQNDLPQMTPATIPEVTKSRGSMKKGDPGYEDHCNYIDLCRQAQELQKEMRAACSPGTLPLTPFEEMMKSRVLEAQKNRLAYIQEEAADALRHARDEIAHHALWYKWYP